MPKPSHDNDNTQNDDFDFLSEESTGGDTPKRNVDVMDSLLDQTLEVKPAAKMPIIRQPVPVSESGPNLSPAERAAKHTKPQAQVRATQPPSDEFDDDFGFLDDTGHPSAESRPAAKRTATTDFGDDWRDGVHDRNVDHEYTREDEAPRRKPVWLAIAGIGALAIGGFVMFQSGAFNSNSGSTLGSPSISDVTSGEGATATATATATAQDTVTAGSSISEQFRSSLARIEGLVANGEFEAASAAIDALDTRVFGYGQPEFTALREQIAARDSGDGLEAEKQRLAAGAVLADQQRIEEERLAAEQIAEERRQAEETRLAAEAQQAEESRLAAEAQRAEEARVAAEAQRAEEARVAAEAQRAEEARVAAEAQRAEEARLAAEAQRAEEARLAAEAQQIEAARQAEEARLAAEARQLEEAGQVEEARLAAEADRQQQATESAARAARQAEEERLQAEAARVERERLEAIASEQRAAARRAASERAAQQAGQAVAIAQPSSSDREATDRLASAATANESVAVQNRGISDAEATLVDRRLQAVKEAIRARNMTRLTALTNMDGARVQAFYQLFTNSSQIDVRVDGSRAQASEGVVVGTLHISRVFGNDGSERVVPANLRNFTLTTRRDGNEWGKFSW